MPKKTTQKKTSSNSKSTKKSTPTRASRPASSKKSTKKAPKRKATKKKANPAQTQEPTIAEDEVTIDRRRGDRRDKKDSPKLERREKVNRRRQIDPTTCERDYSDQEVEFMNALDDYKRRSGRMFPTCSEVLEVVRGLGYVQLSPAELAVRTENEIVADDDPASVESIETELDSEETLEPELVG